MNPSLHLTWLPRMSRQLGLAARIAIGGGLLACGAGTASAQLLLSVPVQIQADAGPEIFPESWRGGQINAAATALDPSRWDRSSRLIAEAANRYPAAVLQKHLKRVFVLSTLSYSGIMAGGTRSASQVYVAFGSVQSDRRDLQSVPIFHAEFSSILLRNLPAALDKVKWAACNEDGFVYSSSGVQAVKDGNAGLAIDARLFGKGFLKQYAQASIEEDFNSFAALLFSGDGALWTSAETEPRLSCKLALATGFYGQVDASFTTAYFKSFIN